MASLDEIAAGFYVDITKINWILVICSKCDSVIQSYEPGSVLKQTSHPLDLHDWQVCTEATAQSKYYQLDVLSELQIFFYFFI